MVMSPGWTFIITFLIPAELLLILGVVVILKKKEDWNDFIMDKLTESPFLWILLIPPLHLHLGIYCLVRTLFRGLGGKNGTEY
jgi:hypothetical protein